MVSIEIKILEELREHGPLEYEEVQDELVDEDLWPWHAEQDYDLEEAVRNHIANISNIRSCVMASDLFAIDDSGRVHITDNVSRRGACDES